MKQQLLQILVEVRFPNEISMLLLLINPPMFGIERIKILEEFNYFHTSRIISEFACAFFFVNFKGSRHILLFLLTIKHCISLVALLFPFHAEPVLYIFVKIILQITSVNTPSIQPFTGPPFL